MSGTTSTSPDTGTAAPAGVALLETVGAVREWRRTERRSGRTVALVPTMGALHDGHLSLIGRATELADSVLVSIFVNPTQFGPNEDFATYPRDLPGDLRGAGGAGAKAVFAPSVKEMYPEPATIFVEPGPDGSRLCGASRPGHFRGVLTVVAKLFAVSEPHVAVFGRKDFQQSVLVRRMVRQLHLPVRIEVADTVREADGLALSSRNAYLSVGDRVVALSLSNALRNAREAFLAGVHDPVRLSTLAREVMTEAGADVEYAEVVAAETLDRPARVSPGDVLVVAARVGGTRLIDNAVLGGI